ncbi:uncharacterized protein BO87DRAFT_163281 [Aspergillus neoniger CBS 115656]|uniref:Uncharacterized protein n=1 Tax=Aspergillus neoniger (strain CBS 115656) TaxID=1448310 RepID=A0A318YZF3_ASPNB|nr:hypothetical protein BO87DRAFT_163281 [Aspergillus neoniger CBS 115656]PYH38193.1 hypothetical protein BO87DRAFT_163281 [Aspergillus neoniger CBS 115656]
MNNKRIALSWTRRLVRGFCVGSGADGPVEHGLVNQTGPKKTIVGLQTKKVKPRAGSIPPQRNHAVSMGILWMVRRWRESKKKEKKRKKKAKRDRLDGRSTKENLFSQTHRSGSQRN